ncbi:hypothetical protein SISSUDRAFT_1064246 [Sistotremastrum suecicum HHB10207 ss-3]|uniref:Uncharacterized protein n=1 Tax=Sistotremastrum suecicum HHB10207 ss-3 TaxID=1314776 RepID=A0A166AUV7_9AGAM|nr:hypothetical protein SISSUDRAFT_1064246 [Sistotremastrum suecicum HHB10207 ss-3]
MSIISSKFTKSSISTSAAIAPINTSDRSIASASAAPSGANERDNDVSYSANDIADMDTTAPLDAKTGRNITISKQVLHRPSDRRRNGTIIPSSTLPPTMQPLKPSLLTGPGSTVSKTLKSIRQEAKKKNKGHGTGAAGQSHAHGGVDGSKALMDEVRELRAEEDVEDLTSPTSISDSVDRLVDASRPAPEIRLLDLIRPRKTRGLARDFEIIPHTKSVLAFNEDDPISPIRGTGKGSKFDLEVYAYDDSDWDVIDDPDLSRPKARKTYADVLTKA